MDEEESDRMIKGPIANYLKKESQTTLDSFLVSYEDKNKFAAIRSKRMQKAVVGLMEKGAEKESDDKPYFVDTLGNLKEAI